MPHCSKCGKIPPLGLKKLFKSFGALLKTIYRQIAKLFNNAKTM